MTDASPPATPSAVSPPVPPSINILLADTDGWKTIPKLPVLPVDGAPDVAGALRKRVIGHLLDVQMSEHLTVLAGLGTSLCVVDKAGKRLAPTMWDLWTGVSTKASATFTTVLQQIGHDPANQDIEALLSRCHLSQALKEEPTIAAFITVAEGLIRDRCEAVAADGIELPHHEAFLRRLISRPTRQPRFKLFTTNYDLCFERAAAGIKAVVIDGFTHTFPQEFDGSCFLYDVVKRRDDREGPEFIPNVFQLAKLHGSVDWNRKGSRILKERGDVPVMIYPRGDKYQLSYNQPYLEMMSRFQEALRTPNTGIIITGFGFNDEHLTQPIISAVRSNAAIRLVVVDPALKEPDTKRPGTKHIKFLESLVLAGDKRIALINGTFEHMVTMMPELSVVPEAENHRQRLLKVDRT